MKNKKDEKDDSYKRPVTALDCEVLLSSVVGGAKKLTSYVDIYKEKGKPTALVKPKRFIPRITWLLLHKKVKEWGGKWRSRQRLWEAPLSNT